MKKKKYLGGSIRVRNLAYSLNYNNSNNHNLRDSVAKHL